MNYLPVYQIIKPKKCKPKHRFTLYHFVYIYYYTIIQKYTEIQRFTVYSLQFTLFTLNNMNIRLLSQKNGLHFCLFLVYKFNFGLHFF